MMPDARSSAVARCMIARLSGGTRLSTPCRIVSSCSASIFSSFIVGAATHAPQVSRRIDAWAPNGAVTLQVSVLLGGREGSLLLSRSFLLMFRAPLIIRHAIDDLARLRVRQRDAALLRFLVIPPRKAIPAEAGQVHQIDVLDIGPLAEMFDEAPECRGLELGAGLVVHRDLLSALLDPM